MLPDILTTFLGAALAAMLVAIALGLQCAFDHGRSGPPIPREHLRRYRWEIARTLLLQLAATAVLALWLSCAGAICLVGMGAYASLPLGAGPGFAAGLVGVGVGVALQLARFLVHTPGTVAASWSYDLSLLNTLHARMSVRGVRWALLTVGLAFITSTVLGTQTLWSNGNKPAALLSAVAAAALASPMLIALTAVAWRTIRRHMPATPPAAAGQGPLNVLMIGCDTLRADHVGMPLGGGRTLTPFLDTLTRRGTLFAHAYTPAARTAPSIASLLTGAWPRTHGVHDNFEAPRPLPVTPLPAQLRAAGYETVAIADWAGSDLGKYEFGFDRLDAPSDQWNLRHLIRQGPKCTRLLLSLFARNSLGRKLFPEIHFLGGAPLNDLIEVRAEREIRRLKRSGQPFLLNIFAATAHPPFASEWPWYQWFSDPSYAGPSRFQMAKLTTPEEIIRSQQEPRDAFDLDQILSLYRGCVRRFDDMVRTIVQCLWREGLGERTLLVIYSDHGMEFFEEATWGQGNSAVPEASPRVPVLLVDPRFPGRGRVDQLVRTVDLAPTILELLGVSPSSVQEMDGVSVAPFIRGEASLPALAGYFETGIWLAPPPGQHPAHLAYPGLLELLELGGPCGDTLVIKPEYRGVVQAAADRAVRIDQWKLVRFACRGGPRYALYRLDADGQVHSVPMHAEPAIAARLIEAVEAGPPRPTDNHPRPLPLRTVVSTVLSAAPTPRDRQAGEERRLR